MCSSDEYHRLCAILLALNFAKELPETLLEVTHFGSEWLANYVGSETDRVFHAVI